MFDPEIKWRVFEDGVGLLHYKYEHIVYSGKRNGKRNRKLELKPTVQK